MIEIAPIQVTDKGIWIPRQYLSDSDEFELVLSDTFLLVRPKLSEEPLPEVQERFPWIGIAETKDPTASERFEEILAEEIDRRAGWTLDPEPEP
ncbi:MAG: hypothetical protein H6658_02770 [Ardenticatenaceae bacterium]|nr:hypothetical protein [Ardenticatenaceae bacterium]